METPEAPYLQIPTTLTKIATKQIAGGWDLTFHVPENQGTAVRELVGMENKQNFVMMLVKVDKGEPCPTKKAQVKKKAAKPREINQP